MTERQPDHNDHILPWLTDNPSPARKPQESASCREQVRSESFVQNEDDVLPWLEEDEAAAQEADAAPPWLVNGEGTFVESEVACSKCDHLQVAAVVAVFVVLAVALALLWVLTGFSPASAAADAGRGISYAVTFDHDNPGYDEYVAVAEAQGTGVTWRARSTYQDYGYKDSLTFTEYAQAVCPRFDDYLAFEEDFRAANPDADNLGACRAYLARTLNRAVSFKQLITALMAYQDSGLGNRGLYLDEFLLYYFGQTNSSSGSPAPAV